MPAPRATRPESHPPGDHRTAFRIPVVDLRGNDRVVRPRDYARQPLTRAERAARSSWEAAYSRRLSQALTQSPCAGRFAR